MKSSPWRKIASAISREDARMEMDTGWRDEHRDSPGNPAAAVYRQIDRADVVYNLYNRRRTTQPAAMTRTSAAIHFPSAHHDHDNCVETALERAESVCRARGLRLTGLRRRVLELVWNSHKPAGAYEILDSLNREGRRAAPPTVYRTLEFLIEADLVHRLDSLNAFVGCRDPGSSHTGQFLICRQCRSVAELDDPEIDTLVEKKAAVLGFTAVRQMVEIEGLCQDCRMVSAHV